MFIANIYWQIPIQFDLLGSFLVAMAAQRSVDEEANAPLLSVVVNPAAGENPGNNNNNNQSSNATPVVIFSTFVAVLGSYVFGTAVSV